MAGLLFLFLLLAASLEAAPLADAVNERIPVRRAELEAHWQVDCGAAWSTLLQLAGSGQGCTIPPELGRSLQLCSFIYQPPGGAAASACPDYQGAAALLEAGEEADMCRKVNEFLAVGGSCDESGATRFPDS